MRSQVRRFFSGPFFFYFRPDFFTFYSCLFIFPVLYYRLRLKSRGVPNLWTVKSRKLPRFSGSLIRAVSAADEAGGAPVPWLSSLRWSDDRSPTPPDLKVEETPPGECPGNIWGISTVGSARHSHGRGQGFDAPMLHAEPERVISRVFLCRFPAFSGLRV